MGLKPWYKVVTPREDLRSGQPLDAAEFAVHLDQIRDGRAPGVYQNPAEFFDRTFLTRNLREVGAEVNRRLSGIRTETSAVFNMTTQFGGGKTHALTLLYHLAANGSAADAWAGVPSLLDAAGIRSVPHAATAVFVGTEFDSITGRGGTDGTPLRRTPWGEIAYQLGGEPAFRLLQAHEDQGVAPAGDVIRAFLPADRPCLILMDELMNYVSRNRRGGLAAQLYNFLQNLSEEARARDNMVLAVSVPASELEMNADDQEDYERFKKLLDRVGKAVFMSVDAETSEIIRRRLFEWDERLLTSDGRVQVTREALETSAAYAAWIVEHRHQLPSWFPVDHAREAFASTYPFHPMVLSVFERKWQALPRFQRTRGVLRLLALWVSRAYADGFKGAHRDPLISLGTAPLDEPFFRAAVFEQLGTSRLEAAITTDICGKKDSHAAQLDQDAVDTIRKARLHRKVATDIFFESNGGQTREGATIPEIRLGAAEPDVDIGNVETVIEALADNCYYLTVDRNSYRFSLSPNLNKLLADRRASISLDAIDERVRAEVQKVFGKGGGADRIFFPRRSNEIPDRAALTLVILQPGQSIENPEGSESTETLVREHGTSARTFKSALIFAVAESAASLRDDARRLLAWEDISHGANSLRLEEEQRSELFENLKKAQRDLTEGAWRAYKTVVLLGRDNTLKTIDLGLVHSSAAESLTGLILSRLRSDGDLEESISPNFLTRNWPPAFTEWSTKAVRDAFFASPQFPRLTSPEAVRVTIARGVEMGQLAYVGRDGRGGYKPFYFEDGLNEQDVEISDDMFIVTHDVAEAYRALQQPTIDPGETAGSVSTAANEPRAVCEPASPTISYDPEANDAVTDAPDQPAGNAAAAGMSHLAWEGEVTPLQWMNFYLKVVSRFINKPGVSVRLNVDAAIDGDISAQQLAEMRQALRDLGLDEDVTMR